jgi:hypothetical protein
LISRYCYRCHRDEKPSGDIDLSKDDNPRLIAANAVVWQTALAKIESHEMPPEDARQPTDEERELLIKFLKSVLVDVDCENHRDPGRPLIRRLNRYEYNQSLRYLTGLPIDLTEDFPADPTSYGFNNIAEALTLTPLQVQQYYDTATRAIELLLKEDRDSPAFQRVFLTNKDVEQRESARAIIGRFAERAFRRPVEKEYSERLLKVYDQAIGKLLAFEESVGKALVAILISPRFLMRAETVQPEESGPFAIDDFDVASRLSFFLWSAPPDEELFELARRGELRDPEQLAKQVQRMLLDGRSAALIDQFFGAWLQFNDAGSHRPDAKAFPEFHPGLREAILEEPRATLSALIREDRPITELIAADHVYVNGELAKHYQIANVEGKEFRRVKTENQRRGGVLTMAALLMGKADPDRTNVPRRGNYLAGTILGTPAPPPPPNVPELKEVANSDQPLTLRERFELHRADASCSVCHAKIDPLGYALENFDAIGRWREQDAGKPIDASGVLPSGETFTDIEALKKVLLDRREELATQFAKQMLIYALGRGLIVVDKCVIEEAVTAARKREWRFSAFVLSIVQSYPFLHRRNPE